MNRNMRHELILPDTLGMRGVLTARIAVPRGEAHKVRVEGVHVLPRSTKLAEPKRPLPDLGRVSSYFAHRALRKGLLDHPGLRVPFTIPDEDADILFVSRPNAFTNLGLHYVLDRIFNINTPAAAITHMGISDDNTAVVAGTLLIDPTAGAGSPDFTALGSGVGATATSRTGNTVTGSAGWEPADFTTLFIIRKVGLSTASTDLGDDTTPTVQGVVNIIGGAGVSPYNEPFTIDLTTVSDFDLTLQQQITAQAT